MIEKNSEILSLKDGQRVRLFPNAENPLHNKPVSAMYSKGYFYVDGSDPIMDGPDYYFGDVLIYNDGFEVLSDE